jgi:exopolyphosphatase/guanosine-5'-triphosphate,3'-diphosphate pyrophosphatase
VTTRVAAIDCGTNSIRLLVAELDPGRGILTDLDRRMRIVRLGEGVDRTGVLGAAALERTWAACDEYTAVIAAHDVSRIRFVATSATRDAGNRADFVAGVRRRLGVVPEVVDGGEEARLSFDGAARDIAGRPLLVVDIGGGSTEFVLGDEEPVRARSIDIGCVRMTERHLHDDPPTAAQVRAATADIDAAIRTAADVYAGEASATLVGLAGSVTTVAGIVLACPRMTRPRSTAR